MEDLRDRIFYCVQEGFEPLRELRVEALMQAPGSAAPPDAERVARDLLDKAAPLCVYNVYNLGPAPTIGEQTFVGMESASQSDLGRAFQRVNPSIAFESLRDWHSLVVTTLRRGIPLFGLVRVGELRRNYLDAVRASGKPYGGRVSGRGAALQLDVEALHLDDELALAADLNPLASAERQPPEPALVFALGVALGIVQPRADDGVYVAVDEQGLEVASFGREPIAAAILLGADDKLLTALDGWIQAAVAERSAGEMAARLEAYSRQPQVSGWERRRIERYARLLRG
jgi:hypothetical protein